MTAYCYVDFDRNWEMANTAAKQERCSHDMKNGAVYLESILRNAQWASLSQCWGHELDVGIFSYLKTIAKGATWVSSAITNTNSVLDEVTYWESANIQTYRTQWQNYKGLGVVETFSVENAFGWQYPLTLKYSNSSSQLAVQTSFKMQWPFATELSQFTANASSHVGLNLIRGSPAFVYTNHTPQAVLTSAGFLSSPLGPGFTLVQTALGPFGSVEMKRLACPSSLQSLYQNLTKYTTSLLSSSSAIQTAFWTIFTSFTMNPTMKAWNLAQQRGGNLLCELNTAVQSFQDRPAISLSSKGSCATGLFESVIGDTTSMIKALLVLPSLNATATASQEPNNPVGSEAIIRQTWDFVQMVVPLAQRQTLQSQAVHIKRDIRDTVQVSFIQYLYVGNTYVLSAVNYFDPRESEFELYSWLFMFDWAQGLREVILFEGEQGKLTSI
ncbi:hypothetical protein As57867_007253, partial [Aphanomyces stellatus]